MTPCQSKKITNIIVTWKLLKSKFLWMRQIFSHLHRWLSFRRWVFSQTKRFVTRSTFLKKSGSLPVNSIKSWQASPRFSCSAVNVCGTNRVQTTLFQIFNDYLLYSILTDVRLIHYHPYWQVTVLQQQLPNIFDVAIHSRLRGATTPRVIAIIFSPFMKPSTPAKNFGSH